MLEKMKYRERLFRWICPEVASVLGQAKGIVREYGAAKDALRIDGKEVRTEKGVIILGHVTNSSLTVTPKLYTEVILSKLEFKSLLHLQGEQQVVTDSIFNAHNTKITGISAEAAEEGADLAKGISGPNTKRNRSQHIVKIKGEDPSKKNGDD